jgi:hypothetical protein
LRRGRPLFCDPPSLSRSPTGSLGRTRSWWRCEAAASPTRGGRFRPPTARLLRAGGGIRRSLSHYGVGWSIAQARGVPNGRTAASSPDLAQTIGAWKRLCETTSGYRARALIGVIVALRSARAMRKTRPRDFFWREHAITRALKPPRDSRSRGLGSPWIRAPAHRAHVSHAQQDRNLGAT